MSFSVRFVNEWKEERKRHYAIPNFEPGTPCVTATGPVDLEATEQLRFHVPCMPKWGFIPWHQCFLPHVKWVRVRKLISNWILWVQKGLEETWEYPEKTQDWVWITSKCQTHFWHWCEIRPSPKRQVNRSLHQPRGWFQNPLHAFAVVTNLIAWPLNLIYIRPCID